MAGMDGRFIPEMTKPEPKIRSLSAWVIFLTGIEQASVLDEMFLER
jgi:hypothetical protein